MVPPRRGRKTRRKPGTSRNAKLMPRAKRKSPRPLKYKGRGLIISYSHSMVPICVNERMRLFQPIERDEFDFVLDEIKGGGGGTACYELDYDQDRFAVTSWDDDVLKTASASLQDMFNACGEAFRMSERGTTHAQLNSKVLAASQRSWRHRWRRS